MEKFKLTGAIQEISQPKFLPSGAEVQTIVLAYTHENGTFKRDYSAPVTFYAKAGLDKLHEKNLGVGDTITVNFLPGGRKNKEWWNADINGDVFGLEVVKRASAEIEF